MGVTYPYPSLMDMDAIEVAAKRKDAYWRVTRISRRSVKVTMWKAVDGSISLSSSDSSPPTTTTAAAPQWRRLCFAVWRRVQCTSLMRLRNGPVISSRVDAMQGCCNDEEYDDDDDLDQSIPNWPGQASNHNAPSPWHPFSKRRWPQGW